MSIAPAHSLSLVTRSPSLAGSSSGRPRASRMRPLVPPRSVVSRRSPRPAPTSKPLAGAGAALAEGVGDGALGLHALERNGEQLVLDEGQAQRLARDGLLDLELVERLRDGRRPDHLVADAVAQLGDVDLRRVDGHPA